MKVRKIIVRIAKNLKFLPVKTILKLRHEYYTGKILNLKNPKEFNEKIQWLKLYYHNPLLTKLACKFNVRSYVEEKIGNKYLNELYGVYENVEDINFKNLPNSFVIKGVHGSSLNMIVEDKQQLDLVAVKAKLNKWLTHNQYKKVGFEWAYKNIKPLIIFEKFLEESGTKVLTDYKFYCFNGVPKYVQVILGRGINEQQCFYDLNWEKTPFIKSGKVFCDQPIEEPSNFEEMKSLAHKLAGSLPFSRVDFYAIEGKTIFGEITFYPSDGKKDFTPNMYNKLLGDLIILPDVSALMSW